MNKEWKWLSSEEINKIASKEVKDTQQKVRHFVKEHWLDKISWECTPLFLDELIRKLQRIQKKRIIK